MVRPEMTQIMIELAERLASRSVCEKRHVGAVITSKDLQRIYSMGYNGGPKGFDNVCMCKLGNKYGCVHAEQNAMVKCNVVDKEKIMFVTLAPCTMCATLMINEGGYAAVYYKEDWKDNPGLKLLRAAGIQVYKVGK